MSAVQQQRRSNARWLWTIALILLPCATLVAAAETVDSDQDGVPDLADNCPAVFNPGQEDSDFWFDCPPDQKCEMVPDPDGVGDVCDNCPLLNNPRQEDADQDAIGDRCDKCPEEAETVNGYRDDDGCPDTLASLELHLSSSPENPVLGDKVEVIAEANDPVGIAFIKIVVQGKVVRTCYQATCGYTSPPIEEELDIGAFAANSNGEFLDAGAIPGATRDVLAEYVLGTSGTDGDGDGVRDFMDNCPNTPNPEQGDLDRDGVGDACDSCSPESADVIEGDLVGVEYCCFPYYYPGGCRDEISRYDAAADRDVYYWEEVYNSVLDDGCGCYDSDGGESDPAAVIESGEIFTAGFVAVETVNEGDMRLVCTEWSCIWMVEDAQSTCDPPHSDRCVNETEVEEYFCGSTGVDSVIVPCPYICAGGRCVCPDTDGGTDYFTRGTLLGETDSCDGWSLTEYFCGNDEAGNFIADSVEISCPHGCDDGACLCQDSDGGLAFDEPGIMGSHGDTCLDERTLAEVYPRLSGSGEQTQCTVAVEFHTCEGLCAHEPLLYNADYCLPPTCEDRIQNQGEEDVDCGGPCPIPCDLCSISEDELPPRFFWGDWKGKSWITPIRDQERCGSCWAFASVAAVEAKALIEVSHGWVPSDFLSPVPTVWTPDLPDLSEQALVSGCTDAWGDCTGGLKNDALSAIRDNGIVDENCFGYTPEQCLDDDGDCLAACGSAGDCADPNSCPYACEDGGDPWDERLWSIANHTYYDERNDVPGVKMALLCKGPLVTSSSDWGHVVAIVGWDNDSELCRNRYGEDGEGGCWILKNSHAVGDPGVEMEADNGDVFDDSYWSLNGFVYIPFKGHDYSRQIRRNVHFVWGIEPPAEWTGP